MSPSPRQLRSPHAAAVFAAAIALGGFVVAAACGANDVDAPAPRTSHQVSDAGVGGCGTFESLMPRFHAAIESGRTEGLREVIHNHLLRPEREGDPAPVNDVIRAVFQTMARFAARPPEAGAPTGETCATPPPAVADAHPLCEMRRTMDTLVHDGKGLDALALVDPLVRGVLDYILGRAPSSGQPHFEVAAVVSGMCQQTATCQMRDTLDLTIGLTAFLETEEGRGALHRLDAMVRNPAFGPFLQDDGQQYGGENGIVALIDVLMTTTLGMDDPSDLDTLPLDQLPPEIRKDAEVGLEDLKMMLDPDRQPEILAPLKKVLNCYRTRDEQRAVIRMFYRLGLESDIPEFDLHNVVGAVKGLRETDDRGSLVHLVNTLAYAIRDDEQAVDSWAKVCATFFSTRVEAGETKSPAELALPVIADLFRDGIAGEAMCAADSLVYGCTGGAQPACEAAR